MEIYSFIGGKLLKVLVMKKDPSSCLVPPEKYICNTCNFKTHLWVNFKQHVGGTRPEMRCLGAIYICEACNFVTHSQLVLLKHVRRSCTMAKNNTIPVLVDFKRQGPGKFKLFYCKRSLMNTQQKRPKTRYPYGCIITPERYQCKSCNFRTNFLVDYIRHVKPKRTKFLRIFVCEGCNFETHSQLVLLRHIYGSCKMAKRDSTPVLVKFKDRVKLLYSVEPPDKPMEKLHKCELCSFQTRHRLSLRGHTVNKHTPLESIVWLECGLCPYKTRHGSRLERHRVVRHSCPGEVKWFDCEQCAYKTTLRSNLRTHVLEKHTAAEDTVWFKCGHCVYESKRKNHLKRHIQEKHVPPDEFEWFKCEHCSYKAKQKYHLKLHVVQKHMAPEDIEWFECEQCSYKAKIRASLKEHVFNKHMGSGRVRWLKCGKCLYRTKRGNLLDKHVLKKHAK